MNTRLGAFDLRFEASGKLAQLSVTGLTPFLHDGTRGVDLGAGRVFELGGWDECFPTIEPYGDSPVMGDLVWAQPRWLADAARVRQEWALASYTATRQFRAPAPRQLQVTFAAVNRDTVPLSFLWASHALFVLQGLQSVVFADGATLGDFRLDGTASKSFRANDGPVRLVRTDCELVLESDQAWWGIWLNRGGWPTGRPSGFGCLGLEATTVAADTPGTAVLAPQAEFRGVVSVAVRT